MRFRTKGDRFVPFGLFPAAALAVVSPIEGHRRVTPALHSRARPCYRETAAGRDRVPHYDSDDQRWRSRRGPLQVPDRWPLGVVLSCFESLEYDRTGQPALHRVAGGVAQNCAPLRDGNFGSPRSSLGAIRHDLRMRARRRIGYRPGRGQRRACASDLPGRRRTASVHRGRPAQYARLLHAYAVNSYGRSSRSVPTTTQTWIGSYTIVLGCRVSVSAPQSLASQIQKLRRGVEVTLCANDIDMPHIRREPG